MRTLIAPTEDFIKKERTSLTADITAQNAATLNVVSTTNIQPGDFIVLGYEGSDTAELIEVSGVTQDTIIADILNAHSKDEPIIKYRYNKRKFYGSLTAGGSYTELTGSGSPILIMVNDPQGTQCEYIGNEGYTYFKATYFNSHDNTETNQSDADEVDSDESLRYCSLYAIRKQAGLTNNPYVTDGMIEQYRKRAENEVDSFLNARYILPLQNSSSVNEIPFLVENCTTLLAAGYMDYQEFGKDGEGIKWLGDARSTLKKLQTPGGQQLLGSDHNEMATKSLSNGIQSFPNLVDNNNGPIQSFSRNQRF